MKFIALALSMTLLLTACDGYNNNPRVSKYDEDDNRNRRKTKYCYNNLQRINSNCVNAINKSNNNNTYKYRESRRSNSYRSYTAPRRGR